MTERTKKKRRPVLMFFDIETEPSKEQVTRLPFEWQEPTPPKNYKDPAKIEAWLQQKRLERESTEQAWLARCALDIDYASIRTIGISNERDDPQAYSVGDPKTKDSGLITEEDLLSWWWNEAWSCISRGGTLLGYNVLGFDIPIIQRRTVALAVSCGAEFIIDTKPWGKHVTDLMKAFYHNGYGPGPKYRGLKQVARLYNIELRDPEHDGADVGSLTNDQVNEYCKSDVAATRDLARLMYGVYWSTPLEIEW